MEVTQFTYFQQVGGIDCKPGHRRDHLRPGAPGHVPARRGQRLQPDLDGRPVGKVTYGDVYHQNEVEQSTYNFEHSNVDFLFELFDFYESEANRLIELDQLPLPSLRARCSRPPTPSTCWTRAGPSR